MPASPPPWREFDPTGLSSRQRYQLITSLVVPRPIGWISTWSGPDSPNVAPFSYFAALSASPLLVGVSVGHRAGRPKDTLVNARARGAFCVNVVSTPLLESMNATSADVPHGTDEFELAGLTPTPSSRVDAPYVSEAPAVLECRVTQEVALGSAPNTLLIAEVVGILVRADLPMLEEGTLIVDAEALRPVGRLSAAAYAMPGEVRTLRRPT